MEVDGISQSMTINKELWFYELFGVDEDNDVHMDIEDLFNHFSTDPIPLNQIKDPTGKAVGVFAIGSTDGQTSKFDQLVQESSSYPSTVPPLKFEALRRSKPYKAMNGNQVKYAAKCVH